MNIANIIIFVERRKPCSKRLLDNCARRGGDTMDVVEMVDMSRDIPATSSQIVFAVFISYYSEIVSTINKSLRNAVCGVLIVHIKL